MFVSLCFPASLLFKMVALKLIPQSPDTLIQFCLIYTASNANNSAWLMLFKLSLEMHLGMQYSDVICIHFECFALCMHTPHTHTQTCACVYIQYMHIQIYKSG